MKNNIIRFILIILIFGISLFIKTSYDKLFLDKENNLIVSKEKKNNNNELLSYLYETEVDSGIYEVSNDTNWNTNDYVFNSELSKCQNGSVLSFNETTNKVILKGNKSDKCYLYFDINNGENDDNEDNLNDNTLVEKIKSLYTGTDGVNHILIGGYIIDFARLIVTNAHNIVIINCRINNIAYCNI